VGDAALLNPLPVMGSALADGPGVMARSFARVNDAPRAANGRTPNRSSGAPPHGRQNGSSRAFLEAMRSVAEWTSRAGRRSFSVRCAVGQLPHGRS